MAGKPLPVRILMERTFNTALMVLEEIDGIPVTKGSRGKAHFVRGGMKAAKIPRTAVLKTS